MKFSFEHFRHCPRCGAAVEAVARNRPLQCAACGFRYFFNAAAAVGAFVVRPDGRSLWLRRAKPPRPGCLGLAGGFVDLGETVEAALVRELREEVGLVPERFVFLGSAPNEYDYAEVRYPVCDLFFEVPLPADAAIRPQPEEVADWVWLAPAEVDPEEIAFPSVRQIFGLWRDRRREGTNR